MARAIYAFSGDPITIGHINIIERSLNVFDELIVGIGDNPQKKYLFSIAERKTLAQEALSGYKNVKVITFKGLLTDYAYENNISTIIRGVRNSEDFNYEIILSQLNRSQEKGIDTFFLPASEKYMHISSSSVKALQVEHGVIHEFVPLFTKQKLEEKLSGQYIIGLTGEIGTGKSYVCEKMIEQGEKSGFQVNRIDIDEIGHEILEKLTEPIYVKLRKLMIESYGKKILSKNDFINIKELGKIIFSDITKLKEFNKLIYKPLLLRLRRELYNLKGLIILDSSLILESEMSYLCNNIMVLISVDKETHIKRLKKNNYSKTQIKNRLSSQYNTVIKRKMIKDKILQDDQGVLFELDNSDFGNEHKINKLFQKIISYFRINP